MGIIVVPFASNLVIFAFLKYYHDPPPSLLGSVFRALYRFRQPHVEWATAAPIRFIAEEEVAFIYRVGVILVRMYNYVWFRGHFFRPLNNILHMEASLASSELSKLSAASMQFSQKS
ncbi:hypothetical protein FHS78_001813 [Parvibaculum indicum]|uniref:hypothetical protein n=1 Tax=Parvibaculum indicum TaxID=562969 RepID=UPI00141DB08C|nr:hypothetical protein [Parvibaculum indicum]NIJ41523.1 hypothetical protein [Parvibaculum indicum]